MVFKTKFRKWEWDKKRVNPKGLFWNYEYRHYIRDISPSKRAEILKAFKDNGLNPSGKSRNHFLIILARGRVKNLDYIQSLEEKK